MRTASQQQELTVDDLVKPQPIRLNVAFAASRMVADKQMVSQARDELFFGRQVVDDPSLGMRLPCFASFLTSFLKRLTARISSILRRAT